MSTRSGKRIHKSFQEGIANGDINQKHDKADKKTRSRSRRAKEPHDELDTSLSKTKKRKNYVAFPTSSEESDVQSGIDDVNNSKAKSGIPLPKAALKEINISSVELKRATIAVSDPSLKESSRQTRRTRRFVEPIEEPLVVEEVKPKKTKTRKTRPKTEDVEDVKENIEETGLVPHKSSKKKKSKRGKTRVSNAHSQIIEDRKSNNTNTSIESYHSATGSPQKLEEEIKHVSKKKNSKRSSRVSKQSIKDDKNNESSDNNNDLINNKSDKKDNDKVDKAQKLEVSPDKQEKINISSDKHEKLNITCDKEMLNSTFEKKDHLNGTFEKKDKLNSTFDKQENLNSTFDKQEKFNTSFDKQEKKTIQNEETNRRMSNRRSINSVPDPANASKSTEAHPLDSSKESPDTGINVTFDKSNDNDNISSISITSDESKTENILNTSPVLIESSMETSRISQSPKNPTTPLKREGTFTKDGPDVIIMSPKPKSISRTPTKNASMMSSPGRTPYQSNGKRSRQRSALNLTRSLEKSSVKSQPARMTKVMFCSPVDHPIMNTNQKKKIIKSSMKGSDKSFVFDDKAGNSKARKRSLVIKDNEGSQRKRKRISDDMQDSVNRLSKPRTGKSITTPSHTPHTSSTSSHKTSRSKLPNFAALHRKQFDKMESLDECQERKAKRAKQLLVANGGLGVLERSSPAVTPAPETEKPKSKLLQLFKPVTKSKDQKPFSRFGFKLNMDVNPFSVVKKDPPKQTDGQATKTNIKEPIVPQKLPKVRKEVAKSVIMREKSGTSGSMRNENRCIIKGVRTNRRFELQMASRNINA